MFRDTPRPAQSPLPSFVPKLFEITLPTCGSDDGTSGTQHGHAHDATTTPRPLTSQPPAAGSRPQPATVFHRIPPLRRRPVIRHQKLFALNDRRTESPDHWEKRGAARRRALGVGTSPTTWVVNVLSSAWCYRFIARIDQNTWFPTLHDHTRVWVLLDGAGAEVCREIRVAVKPTCSKEPAAVDSLLS